MAVFLVTVHGVNNVIFHYHSDLALAQRINLQGIIPGFKNYFQNGVDNYARYSNHKAIFQKYFSNRHIDHILYL